MNLINGKVALDRIQAFMEGEEVAQAPLLPPAPAAAAPPAVEVVGASFGWGLAAPAEGGAAPAAAAAGQEREGGRAGGEEQQALQQRQEEEEEAKHAQRAVLQDINLAGGWVGGWVGGRAGGRVGERAGGRGGQQTSTPAPHAPPHLPPLTPPPCAVPRGALLMVVGAVGSGKSSLLAALLGEMRALGGKGERGGVGWEGGARRVRFAHAG